MRGLLAFSSAVVVLSKVSGFLRGVVVAGYLGASVALDTYNGMLVIVGAVVFIVADQLEMLASAEGPQHHARGKDDFRVYAGEATTVASTLGVVLGGIAILLIPLLTPVLVPGAGDAGRGTFLPMALLLLPVIVLQIPSRVMAALLRGSDRASSSIAIDGIQGIAFLLFAIIALRVFAGRGDVVGIMAVAASQSAAMVLVVIVQMTVFWRATGCLPLQRSALRVVPAFVRRLSVISGLSGLSYGFTLIDRHFAAKAVEGGLSLVNYAGNIAVTLRSMMSYEQLYVVEFAKSTDRIGAYRRATMTCLWLTVPLSGVLPVFATDIVELVFQRGQFTGQMAFHAGGVLAVYGAFTTGFLLWQLMFRILQMENRLGAMYGAHVAALGLSILVTPWAVGRWGLPGAVLGTIAGTVVLLSSGLFVLWRAGRRILTVRFAATMISCLAYSAGVAFLARNWIGGEAHFSKLAAIAVAIGLAYLPTMWWWFRETQVARS